MKRSIESRIQVRGSLRGLLLASVAGASFASVGCAAHEPPPPPSYAVVTTTSGTVSTQRVYTSGYATPSSLDQPSYGISDESGWSSPAATGMATHGSASSGASTSALAPR